jgi:muramoyltetrapeptide carboxypeptidase LdcA involved in peptidoglycan recycling
MENLETKATEKPIIGYLDDTALASLKAEKNVKSIHEVITVDDDENQHATYFTKPTLDQLQVLASYAKKEQEIEGLKILFNTCRVAGSTEVLTDDEMKSSAFKALAQLFKRREAVVKKR